MSVWEMNTEETVIEWRGLRPVTGFAERQVSMEGVSLGADRVLPKKVHR